MATISQARSVRPAGPYPDGGSTGYAPPSAPETMAKPEVPPEIPARRRPTPHHPIPSMQDGFAESLEEATKGPVIQKPRLRCGDAKFRRDALLDQDKDDGPPAEEWRFRPGQRCHELRRLVAQISFGVYLLLEGMANNKVDVISILQGHIDEVDEFLETTLEDIALATKDLQDRLEHLRLPMDNMEIFEKMLEDRAFRLQIVNGNEAIEHIVSRTTTALMQTVQDVTEGLKSTQEFTVYLAEQQHGRWRDERPEVASIYNAMKGNAEGWFNAFLELQAKGNSLNALIVKLNSVVSEMERRAGEVSRRTRFSIQPFTGPAQSPRSSIHSRLSSQSSTSTITPVDAPALKIPDVAPRLSLRFSSLIKSRTSVSSYFDLTKKRDSVSISTEEVVQQIPESEEEPRSERIPEPTCEAHPESKLEQVATLQPRTYQQPEPSPKPRVAVDEIKIRQEVVSPTFSVTVESADGDGDSDESEIEAEIEEPVYILQPRTYTPQPPSPMPSPLVNDFPSQPNRKAPSPRVERQEQAPPVAPSRKPPSPELEQVMIAPVQTSRTFPSFPSPRIEQQDSRPESQPKQRTSLRQRVSLKTTPPESIQVPPPRARERQQPRHVSPQKYQGPDSAYASDTERQAAHSFVSMDPTLVNITPPFRRPELIPSPHSDQQQFFRPVQASPHSPLQQRPHTSHTVTPRHPTYQQQHQRNVPSRMGMSMMSNVTSTTVDSSRTGQTLKKKRSAFGWLKKAFSLDEEERAAFEQKKMQQMPNPYYDARSPKFLDGKRIR